MNLYEQLLNENRVAVIAHRGSSAVAPENTLAAFNQAIDDQADFFELDCQLSADGAVIILHDGEVDRTTDGTGPVADLTLGEIKALDAGSWKGTEFSGERIPTLREALQLAKGHIGIYIEIKSMDNDGELEEFLIRMAGDEPLLPSRRDAAMSQIETSHTRNLELTRKVIDIVRQEKMQRQIVIQSFSPIVCAIALCEAPELRTELLGGDNPDHPEQWANYERWGRLLGAAGMNCSHPSATADRLRAFHDCGQSVAVWTVDDGALMRKLADRGVNALITNRPAAARAVVGPKNVR